MDKIHIALAFCDPKGTYCQHAAVTIASVFANTKSPVCVHVLHDETLTDENRVKLEELAGNFKQEIKFIDVSIYFEKYGQDVEKLSSLGSKGMLFRLFLPEISSNDKMIYLDCDIVVTLDIAELWQIDLQDKSVAAVRDVFSLEYNEGIRKWPKTYGKVWDMIGVKQGEYFNSGVLIMNLKKIRHNYEFLTEAKLFFEKYQKCLFFVDQDFLNSIFSEDKILLPEKFNRIRWQNITLTEISNSIWHYAAKKPWEYYERVGIDELYWQYARQTPWCKNEEELITNMLTNLSQSKYIHLHSNNCVGQLKHRFYDNIFNGHIWTPIKVWITKSKRC